MIAGCGGNIWLLTGSQRAETADNSLLANKIEWAFSIETIL